MTNVKLGQFSEDQGRCPMCADTGIIRDGPKLKRCSCKGGQNLDGSAFTQVRQQMYIDFAKNAWEQEGDCKLSDWRMTPNVSGHVVEATGVPPRCRKPYTHVFVFVRDRRRWTGPGKYGPNTRHVGKKVKHLAAIGRARKTWSTKLSWSRSDGHIIDGKQYKRFSVDDYPLPQGFGFVE